MKKIIAYIKNAFCIGCLLFIASCGDDGVEIVSQDTSWTIDNRYIEEDIREELGINPFVDLVYFGYYNTPLKEVKANYDLEHVTVVGGNDFSFKVKITKPLKEDLTLKLATDVDAQFPVNVEEYTKVTTENCVLGTALLKAGELETIIKFGFKDVDKLKELPGAVLALTLTIENQPEHVAVSKSRAVFFMKVNTAIQLENIEASNEPIDGELFNDNVTFESNIKPDKLGSLNDGNRTSNKWYTSSTLPAEPPYLAMSFPELTTIKGIRIDTNPDSSPTSPSNYALKSVKVLVDKGNGQWLSNGVYDQGHRKGEIYIKFKTPVQCIGIRFEDFQSTTGRHSVDINEITFIR